MRNVLLVILLVTTSFVAGFTEEENRPFSFLFAPGVDIPIGGALELMQPGVLFDGLVSYRLKAVPLLSLAGGLDVSINGLNSNTSITKIGTTAGMRVNLDVSNRLQLYAGGGAGYYYSFLPSGDELIHGGSPLAKGYGGGSFALSPAFFVHVLGSYRYYHDLYSSVGVSVGFAISPEKRERTPRIQAPVDSSKKPQLLSDTAAKKEGIGVFDVVFDSVFPVFSKYYDDHPVGNAVLANFEKAVANNIRVTLFIRQYMDTPKVCRTPAELKPGEEGEIELNALFTKEVLQITEATKAAVEINLYYEMDGEERQRQYIDTIRMYDRNAMTWDDDRKAASFVTPRDPDVLQFTKNVAGMIKGKGPKAVNENLLTAISLHSAVKLFGVAYVIDPKTPFKELSKTTDAVDFLQFPNQTLEYRAGDCDDLSILFCALLESVGIDTAFITIPGHIFMAFSLGTTPKDAKKFFSRTEDLIFLDDETWIPVEVTAVDQGFLHAWELGARQWNEYSQNKEAKIYRTADAWQLYEPVGYIGRGSGLQLPGREEIVADFLEEVVRFIDREIYPRITHIQNRILDEGDSPALRNQLGIVYAQYGLNEKAIAQFEQAVSMSDYGPALINLGNVYYLQEDLKKALEYYRNARQRVPRNQYLLLALAKTYHKLGEYVDAQESYAELKAADAQLAARFSYLESSSSQGLKAGDYGGVGETTIWAE